MKKITTPSGVFGPYSIVTELADRYRVDCGAELPFAVVGIGTIADAQEGDFPPPPPAPVPAPASVSPRQIRQALTRAGLRALVEAAVAAGDQDTKDWYEFSTAFDRANPQVTGMGVALSVSESQLDDLWILAASL